jgi:DnaK suppressor protein
MSPNFDSQVDIWARPSAKTPDKSRRQLLPIVAHRLHGYGGARWLTAQRGENAMTDNLRSTKQALEGKLREVTQSGGWRDTIAIESSADPLDTTQRALEREMATRSLDRNATLVRQIRAAIDRVNQGGYGVCLECEEPISPKRLAAVPWAALCIHCQQRADHANRGVEEWLDDGFANAA